MKKSLPVLFLMLFLCSSCEDDIDISAPYKDIPIVYGLLDRNDTVHYIRIQKCYLVDDNAYAFSSIQDSTYYPSTLQAYILEYNPSGTQIDSIHLVQTINDFPKDSGLFAFTNNILYKGTKTLNPVNTYKLIIVKPNGDTASSYTKLCSNIIMPPPPLFINFETSPGPDEPEQTYTWASDNNAFFYQLSMYFNYEEWVGDDSLNPVTKKVVRHFAVFKPSPETECLSNTTCFTVTKTQFYSILLWNIPADPETTPLSQIRHRRSLSVDVKVSVGAEYLYYYIKFNEPSVSYVQKVSTYTNIENGIGIFSARTTGKYLNIPIHPLTRDSIIYGQKTQHLNFQE
jgi:hypothetical protein